MLQIFELHAHGSENYSDHTRIWRRARPSRNASQLDSSKTVKYSETGWAYTRKSVWVQERERDNRHDLYSWTTTREMPRAKCRPIHDLCRPNQSI